MPIKIPLPSGVDSEAELVETMYDYLVKEEKTWRDEIGVNKFLDYCNSYFEESYYSVFIAKYADKEEIFHETIITLMEKIKYRKIYVEEGVLKGKNDEPFTSNLTSYMMGIAKKKYVELVRGKVKRPHFKDSDAPMGYADPSQSKHIAEFDLKDLKREAVDFCLSKMKNGCYDILTRFYLEEKTLDILMVELGRNKSKDGLKTRKNKCLNKLRECSKGMYLRLREQMNY